MSFQLPREFQPSRGERVFLVGQTGSGKTTVAQRLMPRYGCLAVIDPKCELEIPGVEIYDDPAIIIRRKLDRFIYQPSAHLLTDVDAYNALYKYCYLRKKFFVY